jgi:hypothetical protein
MWRRFSVKINICVGLKVSGVGQESIASSNHLCGWKLKEVMKQKKQSELSAWGIGVVA